MEFQEFYAPYGKNCAMRCKFPPNWIVDTIHSTKKEISYNQIYKTILNPIGCPPLHELAKGAKKVGIIIEDHTRFTPLIDVIDIILDELDKAGVEPGHTIIIGASATHRTTTIEDLKHKISKEALKKLRVVEHHVLNDDEMVTIGTTSRGNMIQINKEVASCDLIIGAGGIAPHGSVKFGGGAKLLLPGVSSFETIKFNHTQIEQSVSFGGDEIRPMRQDMEEAAKMVPYYFNVSGLIDHDGKLVDLVAGDPIAAHREGMKKAESLYYFPYHEKSDLVIACSNPLDVDCFQAVKGLLPAVEFVKPNGTIFWISECKEGIGTHSLTQENDEYNAAMIRSMQERCAIANVILYSNNLEKKELYKYIAPEIEFFSDWDSAISKVISLCPPNAKVKLLWSSPFTVGIQQ